MTILDEFIKEFDCHCPEFHGGERLRHESQEERGLCVSDHYNEDRNLPDIDPQKISDMLGFIVRTLDRLENLIKNNK